MANKNTKKGKNKSVSNKKEKEVKESAPVEEVVEEETVAEEEVAEETAAEEEVADAEVESEVETEDATGDVTEMGVYIGEVAVKVFNNVTHGKDFKKIAAAHAKKMGGVAKPFENPDEPKPEKTVVKIVNQNGNLVRQFALSTHGEDYEELAEAFLKKHGEAKGLKRG